MYQEMVNRISEIETFFRLYARNFNTALNASTSDLQDILAAFAEEFIAASPTGVKAGFNNESLKASIDTGLSFYRSIGICSMVLRSIEATVLDPVHALVKVGWTCVFLRADRSGEIPFFNFYLVQHRDAGPKIFGYITGDEHSALVDNGLIPRN